MQQKIMTGKCLNEATEGEFTDRLYLQEANHELKCSLLGVLRLKPMCAQKDACDCLRNH